MKSLSSKPEAAEAEEKISTDELMDLLTDIDEVASVSDADRTLDPSNISLSSLDPSYTEPGAQLSNVISGEGESANLMSIDNSVKASTGNGMVDLAEAVANQGKRNVNSFSTTQLNNMSGNGVAAIQGDAVYTSASTKEEEPKREIKTKTVEGNKDVAGVKVDPKDVEKHTDGVSTGEKQVASEVSDDGRSLEYVELD